MPALPRLSQMLSRSPRTLASAVCALLLVVTGVLTVGVAARASRVPLEKTPAHNAGQLHVQLQQLRRESEVAMSTQEMALVEQYLSPEVNLTSAGLRGSQTVPLPCGERAQATAAAALPKKAGDGQRCPVGVGQHAGVGQRPLHPVVQPGKVRVLQSCAPVWFRRLHRPRMLLGADAAPVMGWTLVLPQTCTSNY